MVKSFLSPGFSVKSLSEKYQEKVLLNSWLETSVNVNTAGSVPELPTVALAERV